MQYDTIILELLARIKKLEEEVEELKQAVKKNEISEETDTINNFGSESVTYGKMTEEMIDTCYEYGKKLLIGKNIQDSADEIYASTGMNRNSAIMYLLAVQSMLEGDVFKRAISSKALKIFFEKIFNEYGKDGLRKAIKATKLHIEYRRNCGHPTGSLEEICDQYEKI